MVLSSSFLRLSIFLLPTFVFFLLIYYTENDKLGFFANFSSNISIKTTRRYKNIIVHLDLKGAPPRIEYLEKWFKLLADLYVDGILIEYEDMFPYWGEIEQIVRANHYSKDDIWKIQQIAAQNNLEIIPLVQTFGHLEFLLKKQAFGGLREDFNEKSTICVSDQKSLKIIETMIRQVRELHPNSTRIHIGADEANPIGIDGRCLRKMEKERIDKETLKLRHISKVGKIAKRAGFDSIFAWNDMFDKNEEKMLKNAKLQDEIIPVVWGYATDVTKDGYFPHGLFDRINHVFDEFYLASAFKGANGKEQTFLDIFRYFENHQSYDKLMEMNEKASSKVSGVFVTGWSRFSHALPLCELLPVSIPSLVVNLMYLNQKSSFSVVWSEMRNFLKCNYKSAYQGIFTEWTLKNCDFPGRNVFEIIQNDWKSVIDNKKANIGKNEWSEEAERLKAIRVLAKLKKELKLIYFDNDVDEICAQYLEQFMAIAAQPI